MLSSIIRALSLILLGSLFMYWYRASIDAEKEKPKIRKPQFFIRLARGASNWFSLAVIGIQIAGLQILPIPERYAFFSQIVGILLLLSGFFICVIARRSLGANWVYGYEYQIKQKQTLVTTGIYRTIRHPIYVGLFLVYIGGELVAQSMLWMSFLVLIVPLYLQAKREEKILRRYFGESYEIYKKRTSMFIPFL